MVVVEGFKLCTEIGNQLGFGVNREIGIALIGEHTDELGFELCFGLIRFGTLFQRFIGCDNGILCGFGNDVKVGHDFTSLA